ncbi:hypothetical protein T01_6530 [Trichinella spiralis]|uniref:Uncharacterized protein n=1 Tax=Trichinella spiralis TaxID=6334 RepID=A0A0V1BC62_TRISP|nr:hypothetical protein T01_6530 [Trichinella spiralis]
MIVKLCYDYYSDYYPVEEKPKHCAGQRRRTCSATAPLVPKLDPHLLSCYRPGELNALERPRSTLIGPLVDIACHKHVDWPLSFVFSTAAGPATLNNLHFIFRWYSISNVYKPVPPGLECQFEPERLCSLPKFRIAISNFKLSEQQDARPGFDLVHIDKANGW